MPPLKNQRNQNITISKKLNQVQNYLDNILAVLPEQIYWMDMDGKIIGCNEQQAKVFGFTSSKELMGKNIYDVARMLGWDKSIPDNIRANDLFVMKNKQTHVTEELILINNKKRFFLAHKSPLLDEEGKVIGVIGTSMDITDRKETEQLAKEKEIIAEKLALTEAFTGFMAHELRTPMAVLNTTLDTIVGNEKTQDAVERQKYLYQIIAKGKQTVKEANSFIDMLLLKLRSMGKPIKKEDLNLCLILEDVSDALALYPLTEEESAQVTWDKKDAFIYLGDGLHTQHIILNLLKNALKIIREEEKGKINISFEQGTDCNKLIFVDTAKGIAPEFLPTIFDAFVTKDETKKGTGLGLAYCKMIMLDYGGDITCESKLGEYTKFILTFPKANMEEV